MENLINFINETTNTNDENIEADAFLTRLHELMNDCILEYNIFKGEEIELETITNTAKSKNVPNAEHYMPRINELKQITPKYKDFLDEFKNLIKKNYEESELISFLSKAYLLYYPQKITETIDNIAESIHSDNSIVSDLSDITEETYMSDNSDDSYDKL